jgi:Phosphotransferase enzyme family
MRRAEGTAAAHRITRDPSLDPVLPEIAERLGRELARIHRVRPPRPDLAFLTPYEQSSPKHQIASFSDYLDTHPSPRPVLEWGMRWLETHTPPPAPPVLCHHDFRTGNYLIDGARLTGILDWEFAGWGDPHEDIGWFCSKGWRFARLDREAGGIADRAPFYRGYESESGRRIDPARVRFWEVLASVRWAVIALQQSDRHILGGERNLDLALTGRRAGECELALLTLLDPRHVETATPIGDGTSASPGAERQATNDLPPGSVLLALARDVLINDLLPLLPRERRLDARLVANCMAIAEREAEHGRCGFELAAKQLALLYQETTHPALDQTYRGPDPNPPPHAEEGAGGSGERGGIGSSPSGNAGENISQAEGGEDRYDTLLRRFARELRIGAFENSPERAAQARAILWQLTIARVRLANPRFLAANGFS